MRSLSTGEVAKITQTSVQSVIRWINLGMLKAWKVPGSRFRRIEERDLRDFMSRHNIPLEFLDARIGRALIISEDASLRTLVEPLRPHGLSVVCACPFEAGMRVVDSPITIVVIDESLGEATTTSILKTLGARACVIPIVTMAMHLPQLLVDGVEKVSPDTIAQRLTQRIGEMLSRRG